MQNSMPYFQLREKLWGMLILLWQLLSKKEFKKKKDLKKTNTFVVVQEGKVQDSPLFFGF